MDSQDIHHPEKVSAIWLNIFVNKMNTAKSSMIDMKPKHAIKLDTIRLDKSEENTEEDLLLENGLYIYCKIPLIRPPYIGLPNIRPPKYVTQLTSRI